MKCYGAARFNEPEYLGQLLVHVAGVMGSVDENKVEGFFAGLQELDRIRRDELDHVAATDFLDELRR